jgi:hypothetical protein
MSFDSSIIKNKNTGKFDFFATEEKNINNFLLFQDFRAIEINFQQV